MYIAFIFLDYSTFLMYSGVDKIDSITISNNTNINTPFRVLQSKEFMQNVIALSYDYERSLLFYSDIQRGTIDAIHFNGTGHRVIAESMYIDFCKLNLNFKFVPLTFFLSLFRSRIC